jgi:CoA:oxalate CoA-transferase
MCEVLGRSELFDDPRFVDVQARVRNGDAVNEAVEAAAIRLTTDEIVDRLSHAGVPVAPVHDRDAMIADAQVRHREIVVETVHPSAGRIRQARPPVRFSKTPTGLHRHAPRFGEHTDDVLGQVLGFDAETIGTLREHGAIT